MNYNERMRELNKINTQFKRSKDLDKKLDELEARRKNIEENLQNYLPETKSCDIL